MPKYNTNGTFLDIITPTMFQEEKDYIEVGPYYLKTMSLYTYPQENDIGWMNLFCGMKNAYVHYHVKEVNAGALISAIENTINLEKTKMLGSYSEIDDDEAMDNIDKNRELAAKIRIQNSKAINLTTNVTFFNRNLEELEKQIERENTSIKGNRFEIREMNHLQREGFESLMPICRNRFEGITGLDMPVDSWAGSIGIFPSKGLNDARGMYLGKTLSNEPVFLDIWDKSGGRINSNLVILGGSGAGKSVTAKSLLYNQLSRGDKVIILDAEEEYVPLANDLNGNVIETYGGTIEPSIINPLQLKDIPEELDGKTDREIEEILQLNKNFSGSLTQQIQHLKNFFKIYIPELTQKHISILEDMLFFVYNEKGITEVTDPRKLNNTDYPIMEDLYNAFSTVVTNRKFKDHDLTEDELMIYTDLETYLKSAVYGTDKALFNGYTTIELNNPLTVFNVHKLLEAPSNIKSAQFYNITTFCWSILTKNRSEKTILLIDEAHLFIDRENPTVFKFLGGVAKRIRKYKGSLWIATQNIMDFLHPDVSRYGEGIITNPAIKFIMKQSTIEAGKIKELLGLNEAEVEKVVSAVHSGLLFAGDQKIFTKVHVSPDLLKVIST